MSARPAHPLRITPARRQYNRLASDESREDYALRHMARSARFSTPEQGFLAASGACSFLALEAIGGALALGFGPANLFAGLLLAGITIFLVGLPVCLRAARTGLDIDLLTRGTGFGYLGSVLTSVFYAGFTVFFFAIEASILASCLMATLGLPHWVAALIASGSIVPVVFLGIGTIRRFQAWSFLPWIVLNLAPLIAFFSSTDIRAIIVSGGGFPWGLSSGISSSGMSSSGAGPSGGFLAGHAVLPGILPAAAIAPASGAGAFSVLSAGCCASILLVLLLQSAEQADFMRFMPERISGSRLRWWSSLLLGGPGWIVFGGVKLLAGGLIAVFLVRSGVSADDAARPIAMYDVAFSRLLPHGLAPVATFFLILLAQSRINITNAYAGSIALSNVFSRLTHTHPGRAIHVVLTAALALCLVETGLTDRIGRGLIPYAVIAAAWMGVLAADLVICRPLGLVPQKAEFRRAFLPDLNPVGVLAFLLALAGGFVSSSGLAGTTLRAYAPFAALLIAGATTIVLAHRTRGRTCLARRPSRPWSRGAEKTCLICSATFETDDLVPCPAYGATLCSLCCALDARCGDRCKPAATRFGTQIRRCFPARWHAKLDTPLVRFLGLFAPIAAFSCLAFYAFLDDWQNAVALCLAIAGLICWLLVMSLEGHRTAQEETRKQTRLLLDEIAAHDRTAAALDRARAKAEAASLAKTRYISGISHELRTPLNTIMGYAQILARDLSEGANGANELQTITESANHMTALLGGLLDIASIEAGRIEIYRDEIDLPAFLQNVARMVAPLAQAKGLVFHYEPGSPLPGRVNGDTHRLRQILLNLLFNAVKFTDRGHIRFIVRWRAQIAEFIIEDTGPGIAAEDQERIFEPFERGAASDIPGTGLGLTITRLLTEVLGGELGFSSTPGVGTRFRLRFMLSELAAASAKPVDRLPPGYAGRRRRIAAVDDQPHHLAILRACLAPIGFEISCFPNGASFLDSLTGDPPDLLLFDLTMPEMDGRTLARAVRARLGRNPPIIFLTGNLEETSRGRIDAVENATVLAKPVDLPRLVSEIGIRLGLSFDTAPERSHPDHPDEPEAGQDGTYRDGTRPGGTRPGGTRPDRDVGGDDNPSGRGEDGAFAEKTLSGARRDALLDLLDAGDLAAVRTSLATLIETTAEAETETVRHCLALAASYRLDALRDALEALSDG